MSFFFFAVFLLYAAMHLYALLKVRAAFSLHLPAFLATAFFMIIQFTAPIMIHYAEKHGLDRAARILAFEGYTWMGFLFLFICTSLLCELFRLLLTASGRIFSWNISVWMPSARLSLLIPFSIGVCITAYGFYEANHIRKESITVRTAKIPDSIRRLRIVQISDVHVGLIIREDRIRRIIEKVKQEKPDILVSTGDLIDGQIARLNGVTDILRSLDPPLGKYAIPGNHEYYAGIEQALKSTEEAGFRVLKGEAKTGIIGIAGVDDPAGKAFDQYRDVPEKVLLNSLPKDRFRLLLKHRPLVDDNALGLFDLQLSGHTHKGQVFPFTILIHYLYPLDAGLGRIAGGSMLYVSRGTGTWGPPIRFLAPPEITVIDLVHEEGQ